MRKIVVSESQARIVDIDESTEGQRLDNFLSRMCQGVPKSHLYRLIRTGQVRINGRRAKAERKLELADHVRIPPMSGVQQGTPKRSVMFEREAARRARGLPIIYEDPVLIVIDKPAGTAVHGGSGVSSGVIEQLRALRTHARYIELVHRLDRDTSGLLMLALRRSALRALHADLRERKVYKEYLALVMGSVARAVTTIRKPLLRTETASGERRVRVDAQGQEAVTHLKGVAEGQIPELGTVSLVKIRLETGRTHQIRVHLASSGHALLGDVKYGDFTANRILARRVPERLCLHAYSLRLAHPTLRHRLNLRSPVPPDFERILKHAGIDTRVLEPLASGQGADPIDPSWS